MSKRLIPILAALLAIGVSVPVARGEMRVHIIDVGQAASALVELDHAAILIDAGGEDTTPKDRDAKSIQDALTAFFARRTDLHNTIEAVIISHPHMDHTMNLMTVMQGFTVRTLVDNGDPNTHASGFPPLKAARAFAKSNHIPNVAVKDSDIPAGGKPLALSPGAASGAQITLLSGFRGCKNANNDSIAVLIKDGNASALFAGDAEEEDTTGACKIEPQLQHLVKRFGTSGLLEAKLYHVTHHGSPNGVFASEIEKVHPAASIISAGRLDPANRVPGGFHAFQFGHPRKEAIDSLIANTTGSRPGKQVSFMAEAGVSHPDATPTTIQMTKAVYCTCWDGNIDITFAANGDPRVEPLGAAHSSGPTPPPPPPPAASCNITPADVFTPVIKPPDSVTKKPADYFMLSLSWSPQFCTTSAGKSAANAFQCKENSFGMVVHGLWAQSSGVTSDKGQPRNCKTTIPIVAATLRQHLCTVPGVQLEQDEWAKHGTCAFDAPEKFLDTIEKLRSELHVPDLDALAASKGSSLKAQDVTGAFLSANSGLSADDVQLLLSGKNLSEVHVCYDLDFKFRKCDTKSSAADTTKVTIRPSSH
jgi:ribonuclease T2